MNIGTFNSEPNPNSSWLSARGAWAAYTFGVFVLHVVIRCAPLLSNSAVWTLTNVMHDVIMFMLFHQLKSAPWETTDQGASRRLTYWEQIDSGCQYTATRKFLTIFPVALYFLAILYSDSEWSYFFMNTLCLLLVLLPKLPQFHKVRIFDINKY